MARTIRGKKRNQPCPCGSGKKFKKCCGDPRIVAQKKSEFIQMMIQKSKEANIDLGLDENGEVVKETTK